MEEFERSGRFNDDIEQDATMEDTDYTDKDGFPVQAYTVHFGKLINPDPAKSKSENIAFMMEENSKIWKHVYEDFYKKPLTYLNEE